MRATTMMLVSVAMATSAAGSAAQATVPITTVSPTETASGGSISSNRITDYSSQIGSLALFNGSAGTLVGVAFTVGYSFDSTITVASSTPATGSVAAQSAANFNSSNASIADIFNRVINNKPDAMIGSSRLSETAYDLTGNQSNYNLSAGTSQIYTSRASATNVYEVSASDFAAFYAGAGSATFDVSGTTLTGLILNSTGGNASASQLAVATQRISVAYTYFPAGAVTPAVPEPSTWIMMMLGFGLVAGAARYRRRSTTAAIA